MDVTRNNFNEVLPAITKAINEASFISFDTEFTGLSNKSFNVTLFDPPEERYEKLLYNVGDFQLLQFGLSVFCFNDETENFKVDAYNFYIFPFPYACSGYPDKVFSCQSSSIDFLINQGFDFNKVFKEGLPYLRLDEEPIVSTVLKQRRKQREGTGSTILSPIDQETKVFIESVCEKVKSFLNDSEQNELLLAPCNSFLRKVLYENIPLNFPDLVSLDSHYNEETKQRQVLVRRGNNDLIKQARLEELKVQEEGKFQNAIGFSKIIKLLTESKKLIVGHNMFLDLLFTIKQFVSPLPLHLSEFKTLFQSVFPRIVDTKLMGNLLPFKELLSSTVLGDLYSKLQSPPFSPPTVLAPDKYKIDGGLQKTLQHDAGYDSFITGFSFLSMFYYLKKLQKSSTSFDLDIVTPYINKVCVVKSHDLPYINLGGSDLKPDRDHVFHVRFPLEWKTTDLRQLFSPFGNVTVSWIDSSSCFISLHDTSQIKHVKEMILSEKTADPGTYQITSYAEHCSARRSYATPLKQLHNASKAFFMKSPASSTKEPEHDLSCNQKHSAVDKPKLADSSIDNESHQPCAKKRKLQNDGDTNDAQNDMSSSLENADKVNRDKSQLFDVPSDW